MAVVLVASAQMEVRVLSTAAGGVTESNVGVLQVQAEDGQGFGTICGMNLAAADIACRQLGHDYGSVAPSACGSYGGTNQCGAAGTGVAMKELRCTGRELSLDECAWSTPDAVCLDHSQDSIVYCGSAKSASTGQGSVRLLSAEGAPSVSGRGVPEVFYEGRWSRICGVTPGAVLLLCKAMGFSAGSALLEEASGIGSSSSSAKAPSIGELTCSGSEASVLDCSFESGEDVYCAASEAAAVHCLGDGDTTGGFHILR